MSRHIISFVCVLIFFFSCKKNDINPPEVARLIFPQNNQECTTGQVSDDNTNQIVFKWSTTKFTDFYQLRVVNSITKEVQNIRTSKSFASVSLVKGQPYSWQITSENSKVEQTVSSEVWNFYNAGALSSFVPFSAKISSPSSGETVFKDANNEIELSWLATDLDNDIAKFEIYFSTNEAVPVLFTTVDANINNVKVTVSSGATYYWSVVVIDQQNNRSKSNTYSFKVF